MLRHADSTKQKAAGSPRRTATRTLIFPTKCSSFGESHWPDFGQLRSRLFGLGHKIETLHWSKAFANRSVVI
jgi:hypothetical protein